MEIFMRTALYATHIAANARMVPFAGYDMPVQYEGVLPEHLWTRQNAGLFDVSHMGQLFLSGASYEAVALALEKLVPADILNLKPHQQRYTQLLNADGGCLDDLMVTRTDDNRLYLVVNAGCKTQDIAFLKANLPANIKLDYLETHALIALQGPKAQEVLKDIFPAAVNLKFMHSALQGEVRLSRAGYTGEDGFEISLPNHAAQELWEKLAANPLVKPIGLGARDSLRLEAGLCLYGHELNESVSPLEAGLNWSIQKRRREEGGFNGFARYQAETKALTRKLVAILPEGRAPARENTVIMAGEKEIGLKEIGLKEIGIVTSGGFAPSLNAPIALGFVPPEYSMLGTEISLMVRGKALPAKIVALPFVPHNYKRA
jgi:aminomethyltransferase